MPQTLRERSVYMVDGRGRDVSDVVGALGRLETLVTRHDMEVAPLSELR
jgi:hypothetical protein